MSGLNKIMHVKLLVQSLVYINASKTYITILEHDKQSLCVKMSTHGSRSVVRGMFILFNA